MLDKSDIWILYKKLDVNIYRRSAPPPLPSTYLGNIETITGHQLNIPVVVVVGSVVVVVGSVVVVVVVVAIDT